MRAAAFGPLAFVVACSSSATPATPVKPTTPPIACPLPADRSPEAFVARRTTFLGSLNTGREVAWQLDAPVDANAARTRCNDGNDIVRVLCFEGIAQSYGFAIAKKGDAAALRDAPSQLAKLDEPSSVIHCRGLGAGLHAGGIATDKLAPLIANVDARCKTGIVDGYSTRVYMTRLGTPKPTQADIEAQKLDDACAGLDARWCAFGAGRGLAHLFPGDPVTAARGCQGAQRAACLSGIAYVTAYLYDSHDLGYSAQRVAAFTGDDRAGYVAGVGSALQWSKRASAERLELQLACAPEPDRTLMQRIRSTAEACNAFDFADGTNCRWADVK